MIKQIVILIVLTIIIILTRHYFAIALNSLWQLQNMILTHLNSVFSTGQVGTFLKSLIAFLAVPFIVGIVVGSIYALMKKQQLGKLMHVIWAVWLIMATLLIVK